MSSRALATAVLAGNALGSSAFVTPKFAAHRHVVGGGTAVLSMEKGAGGMFDTRNPDAMDHEDPRKSISAAPSFEEYLKSRGDASSSAPAPAAAAAPAPVAPPPAAAAPAPAAAAGGGGGATCTPDDATSALKLSQATTLGKIAASIPDLAPKPDLSWSSSDDGSDETVAGHRATLEGHDAPGPANVAWISDLTVDGRLSSLTVFNGPLNDVPHLVSRTSIDEDGTTMTYELDFRPRAYGAYELIDDDGNYPGPETFGRKAFEYSAARNDFFGKFCDDEVKAFFDATASSFEGGTDVFDASFDSTEFDKLTRGPLALAVEMPLTEGNVAAVAAAQERAADYWLGWATDGGHGHRPGAPVNTQYVYDAKFRINAYSGLLPKFTEAYGAEDGAKLAAADSGPLDEAYVGGGS